MVAVRDTDSTISDVPEPGAAMEAGLKLTVTPVGWPLALKATAELKLPVTVVVIVTSPLWFCRIDPEVGETEMLNPPVTGAVTVSDTVAACVVPPPVPDTVMV